MIWEYLSNLDLEENIKKVLEYKLNNFYNRRNKSRHLFLSSVVDMCMYKDDYENKLDELESKYEIKQDIKVKKKKRETLDLESINLGQNNKLKIDEDGNKYYNSEWNDFYFNFIPPKEKRSSKRSKKNIKKETIDKESDEEIDLEKISDEIISDEESDKEVCKVKVL